MRCLVIAPPVPVAWMLAGWILAASPTHGAPEILEPPEVERLASLTRAWGFAAFHHPALAGRSDDWAQALVEAIPRVRASSSVGEWDEVLEAAVALLRREIER